MRAEVPPISAILVVIILLSLVSTALVWVLPLIQKRRYEALVGRIRRAFDQAYADSLPRRIRYLATYEGEESFIVDADGVWNLSTVENSIRFEFESKVSDFSPGEWVALPDEKGNPASCPPTPGDLRRGDSPAVVCVLASRVGDRFLITYKVWFRAVCELIDQECDPEAEQYEIRLRQAKRAISTSRSIRMGFNRRYWEEGRAVVEVNVFLP